MMMLQHRYHDNSKPVLHPNPNPNPKLTPSLLTHVHLQPVLHCKRELESNLWVEFEPQTCFGTQNQLSRNAKAEQQASMAEGEQFF